MASKRRIALLIQQEWLPDHPFGSDCLGIYGLLRSWSGQRRRGFILKQQERFEKSFSLTASCGKFLISDPEHETESRREDMN